MSINIDSRTQSMWEWDINEKLNAVVPETAEEVVVFKKVLESILEHEKLPIFDDKFKKNIADIQELLVPVKKEEQSEEEFQEELSDFLLMRGARLVEGSSYQKIIDNRITAKINDLAKLLKKDNLQELLQTGHDQKMKDVEEKKRKYTEVEQGTETAIKIRKI